MVCNYIYLELRNACKNFMYTIDRLYYSSSFKKDLEYFYRNLNRFIHIFLNDLESNIDRYKRCIDLSNFIKTVKKNLYNQDTALLYIYDFCSEFE